MAEGLVKKVIYIDNEKDVERCYNLAITMLSKR
jgi:hypothetical protein